MKCVLFTLFFFLFSSSRLVVVVWIAWCNRMKKRRIAGISRVSATKRCHLFTNVTILVLKSKIADHQMYLGTVWISNVCRHQIEKRKRIVSTTIIMKYLGVSCVRLCLHLGMYILMIFVEGESFDGRLNICFGGFSLYWRSEYSFIFLFCFLLLWHCWPKHR